MAIDTASAPPRRRNILLIVSLCLNVALAAMIAIGVYNAAQRNRQRATPGGPLAPQALMAEVGPVERAKIQAVIDKHAARLKELRIESAQARGAAFRIFAEPSFTPQDFSAALERVRAADTAWQDEAARMTAESVAQLTPQERQAIAQKIRARARPAWRLFMPRRGGQ
jgi:uncharacterized membrane protein